MKHSLWEIPIIRILISCGCILFIAHFLLRPSTAADTLHPVKLISHRGLTTEYPENSLASLRQIIKAGIHGAEIDLRTTKDGHIVIIHDETLDRTTTGKGPVRENTWPDIKRLNLKDTAGKPTSLRLPDFDQVLALVKSYPDFELALDLKDVDAEAAAKTVLEYEMAHQVLFFIADPMNTDLAKSLKQRHPGIQITVDMLGWWKIEDVPVFAAKALDAYALFASEWFFPKRGFGELKKAGIPVYVYLWGSHQLKERFERAVKLGADAISCDTPKALLPFVIPASPPKGLRN